MAQAQWTCDGNKLEFRRTALSSTLKKKKERRLLLVCARESRIRHKEDSNSSNSSSNGQSNNSRLTGRRKTSECAPKSTAQHSTHTLFPKVTFEDYAMANWAVLQSRSSNGHRLGCVAMMVVEVLPEP